MELSSKVTRQLCLELLTWGTEKEGQHEKVAGEEPLGHGLPLPSLSPKDIEMTPTCCAPGGRAGLEGEGRQQFLVVRTRSPELHGQGP